ncbi:hypothetical protein C1646_760371 [Rhizophagus diaphanus]|nr:hypothetical protein C1646_760371 [Rhizophagus diaphanus] [Rhizophagus sp. MUCL 43196]
MEKVDDVISEKEYDNDAIIYDDVNNLPNRKRKRRKKIFLQTEIDELWYKLHANKYFMKEIIPKLVHCKCGKEIRLDQDFRDKNLTTHGELSNCKYSGEGQQSIKVFFKPKKIRYEEENTIVQKVACKGLYEEKYREYVLNSPAEFRGSVRPDIATKELFSETIQMKLRLKRDNRLIKAINKVSADEDNDNMAIWTKLVQFGKDGFFKEEKIFQELVSLMIQIQEKKLRNKKTTGLRYSEHLKQFFSLLSESNREYEIFRQMFAGMSVRSIIYLRAKEVDVVTNPELIYENILKFFWLIKALNWNRPVIGMTDSIATQVRVIVLKIPIEKIPPLVISMLLTNGGSNAAEIYDLLINVITMSQDAGVNLVSLGSDGTPVEYNA